MGARTRQVSWTSNGQPWYYQQLRNGIGIASNGQPWYSYWQKWAILVLVLQPMGNLGIGIDITSNGQPWGWYWYCIQWASLVLQTIERISIQDGSKENKIQNNTDNSIHINIQKDNFRSIKNTVENNRKPVNPGVCGCSSREPQLRSRCQPGQDGTRGYPQVAIMII